MTQLAFSPDDSRLLCVSRDRTLSVHRLDVKEEQVEVVMEARTSKATSIHQRLIWTCAWAADSKVAFEMLIYNDKRFFCQSAVPDLEFYFYDF